MTLGTEGGNLTLLATHGPIVLSQRPRYPHEPRDPASQPHFSAATPDGVMPSSFTLGASDAPSFDGIFRSLWPAAVNHALLELRDAIRGDAKAAALERHHLSVCQLWQDLTSRLGPPELISPKTPQPLADGRLAAIARAGAEFETGR